MLDVGCFKPDFLQSRFKLFMVHYERAKLLDAKKESGFAEAEPLIADDNGTGYSGIKTESITWITPLD